VHKKFQVQPYCRSLKRESILIMFQKPANRFRKFALAVLFYGALAFQSPGQSIPSTAANPPPENYEPRTALEDAVIHVNQVAYDEAAPKCAVLETARRIPAASRFLVRNALTAELVFEGTLAGGQECEEWFPGRYFYRADFSPIQQPGHFKLQVEQEGKL
jgi:hypothetical protein